MPDFAPFSTKRAASRSTQPLFIARSAPPQGGFPPRGSAPPSTTGDPARPPSGPTRPVDVLALGGFGRDRLLRRRGGRCRLFRCHGTAAGAGGRLAHGRTPALRLLLLERRRRGGRCRIRIH